ncbi:hypothetical protein SQ11_11220 [Nitrosospira sp. NpAV]|nr:hypothetical protein SQ11_11220 [Nitrosospira sp. NpAV]
MPKPILHRSIAIAYASSRITRPLGKGVDVKKIFEAFFSVELEVRMLLLRRRRVLSTVRQLRSEATVLL